MKVRICYTVEVDDGVRRAIREFYGLDGLATREEVKAWYERFGSSEDLSLSGDEDEDEEE